MVRTDVSARMGRLLWCGLMLVGTIASGYRLGTGIMIAEAVLGARDERRSLESGAKPLSAKAEAAAG
ncbi:hypothetical protein ACFPN7_13400 [Amycolatopsis halotolerans]|uniref:hypothetical protein n=1 Tax=Amycolatopsis halotolerans TaxID=330083 RepID=UPI003615FA93